MFKTLISEALFFLQGNVSLPPSIDRKAMTLGLWVLPWGWHGP